MLKILLNLIVTTALLTPSLALSKPTMESVFSEIYKKKMWARNKEGKGTSGVGSTLEATELYREFLQDFLSTFEIETVVDAGCGDWEFSKAIDWTGIQYTGYDVVKFVINENMRKYSSDNITFIHTDLMVEPLPPADLLICKDVLQHWPNAVIFEFLKNISQFKYCLITNDIDFDTDSSSNPNVWTGGFRTLDLTKAPFFLDGIKIFSYAHGRMKKQVLLIISESTNTNSSYSPNS
jgi:SAM-dependent methyltransferase